jgi:hypothetical protein
MYVAYWCEESERWDSSGFRPLFAQHAQPVALPVVGQSGQVEATIFVEQENVLAMIASLRDVVRHTGRHHAGLSGHGSVILCHGGCVLCEFGL